MNGDKQTTKANPDAEVSEEKELTTVAEGAADRVEGQPESQLEKSTTNNSTGIGGPTDVVDQPISPTSPKKGPTKSKPQKTNGAGLFIALLLLIMAAIGGLVWYGWTYYIQPQQQRLQALEDSVNSQLEFSNRLDNRLNDRQQSAAKVKATTEKLLANLRRDQNLIEQRLEAHTNRLRDLSGTSRNDWMLAEAKYLLRLASQRLLMERGTVGALALLESVDKILTAIDDVDLFIVREAVAKDIMALKLAPTVDREGIYLQLAALIDAVEKLPALPLSIPPSPQHQLTPPTKKADSAQTVKGDKTWHSSLLVELKDILDNFGQFIRIRHYDKPPEPLLSDEYQYYLIHNLRLMFEQSQLALLREQPEIYQQSLEQTKQWLNQYYVFYSKKDILVTEINRLQQQPIVQVLPDISGSLEQLVDYIDRYHKLTPEKSVVEAVGNKAATERPLIPPENIVKSKGVPPTSQNAVSQDGKEKN